MPQWASATNTDASVISALFAVALRDTDLVGADEVLVAVVLGGAGAALASTTITTACLVSAVGLAAAVWEDVVGINAQV